MENKLLENLNKQLDKWIIKRRQATIAVCDLANQIEDEEKRILKAQKTTNPKKDSGLNFRKKKGSQNNKKR